MPPLPGLAPDIPAGAHFVLEANVDENSGAAADLNYVAAALTLNLDSSQDYRLVINGGAGGIEAAFNGIPQRIDAAKIGRVISVNVEFTREGLLPKNIVVVNRTDLTVNMNIFGVPGADYIDAYIGGVGGADSGASADDGGSDNGASDGGSAVGNDSSGAGDFSGFVEVSPVSGSVGVMFLSETARAADSVMRSLTVTVCEVRPDGLELARIEARKYVPG
jgi:hypothetical protein